MTTSPGTPEASPDPSSGDELSVGMVGYAFMGAAHSQAWRNALALVVRAGKGGGCRPFADSRSGWFGGLLHAHKRQLQRKTGTFTRFT